LVGLTRYDPAELEHDPLELGIDVGGTFTDIVLMNLSTGEVTVEKTLTTPADPSEGILDGLRRLKANGKDLRRVRAVIHGTTLVANALIERRGAKTGLLATRGFRDILHFVGRELRYDVYDPNLVMPEPLIPRRLRREVDERIASTGAVIRDLDREHARGVVRGLLAEKVEALAVSLLHSYINPIHEQILGEIIHQEARDLAVSLSHEVLPQVREYERTSATAINAYVQPIVRSYLQHLKDGLRAEGMSCELYLMTSFGGAITVDIAQSFPIQLVESGPAAGTLVASRIGEKAGLTNLLSFDMGGTTAKSCVIQHGRPLINKNHEVARARRFKRGSGLPLGVPVIDLLEIGAGGGSIAEIDELGLLRVGPTSVGADPGPACYGLGGGHPTVTDANLILGFLNPEYFLGGAMKLDANHAARVIEENISRPLGLSLMDGAAAINRVVTENMTEAARVHSVEMNVDIEHFALLAFGGAGPIHAYALADRLRLPLVICPPDAGVLSALGLLVAPLAFEFARTFAEDLDRVNSGTINEILASLERDGRALLNKAGVEEVVFEHSVDMCYVGQGFEVTTPLPFDRLNDDHLTSLKRIFDDTYEKAYGRRVRGLPARCLTWRVLASGPMPRFDRAAQSRANLRGDPLKGRRVTHFPEHGPQDCSVYERSLLATGVSLAGPLLIEDKNSTISVPPGMWAEVDQQYNVVLRR